MGFIASTLAKKHSQEMNWCVFLEPIIHHESWTLKQVGPSTFLVHEIRPQLRLKLIIKLKTLNT